MKRIALAAVITAATVTACTPTEIEAARQWIAAHPAVVDCNTAVARHWPASTQRRARSIVWRESRNNPTAQNRRSSAAGCFQLLAVHSPRFRKLGLSWSHDRYNADANARVALDLYRTAGWSPWAATA